MKRIVSTLFLAVTVAVFCWNPRILAVASSENGAVAEENAEAVADEAEDSEDENGKNDEQVEESSDESQEGKSDRKTAEVEAKTLKIEETIDGVFVAETMEEISLTPEEWSTFKIEEVVSHGDKVAKGDTLLKFEDKDLLEAIANLDIDLHLSEQSIMKAEKELPQKESALKRQLALAEEALRRTEEDHKRYKEDERKRSIDMADMSLKSAEFSRDYYRDELEQLEKMYGADELTEETEEIILRRQRFYVERAEFDFENSKFYHQRTMDVALPRRDRDFEESLESTKALLERAQLANEVDPTVARYELEKQRRQRAKSQERHVKLLSDKSLMTVRSPMAGVVYYGGSTDGKWPRITEMRNKLLQGKNADRGTVLMTVVDPSSLTVLSVIDQKLRISVKEGQEVKVQPNVEGADPLKGKVKSISSVPISDGKFQATIEFSGDLPEWLVPGMSGKVTAVTYHKKDALLVSESAVHEDDESEEKYVWLVRDDEVEKKIVETGKKKDGKIEITKGLSAGDSISLDDEEK